VEALAPATRGDRLSSKAEARESCPSYPASASAEVAHGAQMSGQSRFPRKPGSHPTRATVSCARE
jgi:hypothetical protein